MGQKIETLFSRQKEWRPATRQDRCAPTFGSAIIVLFCL